MQRSNLFEVLNENLVNWGSNRCHGTRRVHVPIIGNLLCIGFLDGLPETAEVDQTAQYEYQLDSPVEAHFSLSDFRKDNNAKSIPINGLLYPDGYGSFEFDNPIVDHRLVVGLDYQGSLTVDTFAPDGSTNSVDLTYEQARGLFVACMRPLQPRTNA